MHDGCTGQTGDGQMVVNKVRMMGFAGQFMPMAFEITCHECKTEFTMEHFEGKCPKCNMVYGVTPCHAFDPANIMAAGVDY